MSECVLGSSLFLASVLISSYYKSLRGCNIDKKNVIIKELWIYPIKSCKGIQLSNCRVNKTGFMNDRMLMVVDSNNKFVSQRTKPQMALVSTAFIENENGQVLVLSGPGMETLHLRLSTLDTTISSIPLVVNVWGDQCESVEISEGSRWFSKYLSMNDLHLVRMTDEFVRHTDSEYAPNGQTSFADGYPFLLSSQESLNHLNSKLDKPVTFSNFRPNIIVEGCEQPYAEDLWKSIRFHNSSSPVDSREYIDMKVVKPCSRCKMPTIDPETGEFDPDNQPLKAMKAFRTGLALGFDKKSWKGEIFFGQNLDHEGVDGSILSVGDTVTILS